MEREEELPGCARLRFSDDGNLLYRSSLDEVQIYDVRTRQVVHRTAAAEGDQLLDFVLTGKRTEILCHVSSNEGDSFDEFDFDCSESARRLALWDLRAGKQGAVEFLEDSSHVWNTVQYSRKESVVLTHGGTEQPFVLYDRSSFTSANESDATRLSRVGGWTTGVSQMTLAADGSTLVLKQDK